MLHIHNGDSSAGILKESGLPGEHLAWREALIAGPTPLNMADDEWRRMRAAHLAEAYELKPEDCLRDLVEQDRALSEFAHHEETVLWFEHDLFCQLHLVYLLQWFAKQEPWQTRLSLICIGRFPGVEDFRGLGQLNPAQMCSLFDARREVSDAQLTLARTAWQAYCAPAPLALQEIIETENAALPFLNSALLAHLARFPAVGDGLGRIERQALRLVHEGHHEFARLFQEFGNRESIYGLGDFQLWNELQRMTKGRTPLLTVKGDDEKSRQLCSVAFLTSVFEITPQGIETLEGKTDAVRLNEMDLWLGGVHLSGAESLWRWDEDNKRLVAN